MCPKEEVELREREKNLLHVLEVLGPVRKLVKCYSRSAADSNMVVPHLLRPYPVLKDTVQYLLLEVTKRVDVSMPVMYDFVDDRLRAVRQDMTIQRIPPELCINLLEPMVRFYVYYGYRLGELGRKDYDPIINKKNLLECLKWCLSCYDQINYQDSEKLESMLSALVSNMKINNTYKLKCDRVLMESLYMLCNIDDVHPQIRYLSLPKHWKSKPTLKLAYQAVIANEKGNYVKVCRLMDQMCILTCCAVCVHLPILQRRAFQVMSHAYNSKTLSIPASVLRRWLMFSSDAEVIAACSHYGLKAKAGAILFCKTDFKSDAAVLQPKKLLLEKNKCILNTDINYIFTYDTVYK